MALKQRDRVEIIILLTLILAVGMGLLAMLIVKAEPQADEPVIEAAAPPTPLPSLVPIPEQKPELRERTELLVLVNPWNPLPNDYETELSPLYDEQYIDRRAADPLSRMLSDCQDAGNAPYICSAYRTMEQQQALFDNKVLRVINEGADPDQAPEIAAMSVAVPGTSEHQLGLAVDIIDYYYPYLNQEQENTSTQQWLMENSWRYGFILRYPSDKSEITGIVYEPWHYRYVGVEAAQEIYELGVTLEEYLDMFYEPLSVG